MLTKTRLGTNEDGTPQWHYACDGPVVVTGPITGHVTVPDGTVYDVTPPVIEVKPGHEHHVAHQIGLRYEAEGHPLHPGKPFVYERPANASKLGLKG